MTFKKGNIPWDKGKKNPNVKNNPQIFKKGQHPSPSTEFKKGYISPYKGKKRPEVTGNKSNFWKGGITPLAKQIRNSEKYKQWRSDVFKRDNWTCQTCCVRGCYLQAHHKKSFAKILEENNIKTYEDAMNCKELWDVDNGVTLCHDLTKLNKGRKYERKC